MTYVRIIHAPALLAKAQTAMGLSQEKLGHDVFACSRRTMSRWVGGQGGPSLSQWVDLVRHVYPHSRAVAAEIASEMGETLVSLRLEAPDAAAASPPPRPAPSLSDLVDSVVCAAAEAVAMSPQAIRPALVAGFERVASLSLSVDDVRGVLRPSSGKKK
jgi:hypothetical protein